MSENPEVPAKHPTPRSGWTLRRAVGGAALCVLAGGFAYKPYLPGAIYHNYANIDDYKIFKNRVVKANSPGLPWKIAEKRNPGPPPKTMKLLANLKTTAVLMIEDNQLVYEQYFLTGGEEQLSGSFSAAKTLVGLLIGFALQEHYIKSLDEPIGAYLPEWSGRSMGKITIKNLLTMTSGLDWDESYQNPLGEMAEAYYGSTLRKTTLRQKLVRTPGSRHQYQSGATELLGLVLAQATQRPLAQYASEKLWIPLGAERDALWSVDTDDGVEKAYCCFSARARDFARVGQLLLNRGQWPDAAGVPQQLLNREFLREMTTPHGIPDASGKPVDYYGYQIWLLPTAHGTVPYARGILGQYIISVPHKKRVVVRLGMKRGTPIAHHPEEVRALVDWAMD